MGMTTTYERKENYNEQEEKGDSCDFDYDTTAVNNLKLPTPQ